MANLMCMTYILMLPVFTVGSANFLNHVANYVNLVSAYHYGNEYDTVDVIPLEDVSRVMEVNVGLSLFAINGFDEVAGRMDLVAAMNMSWIDEIPLITSSVFIVDGRESFLVPHDKIWTPKLVLKNAVGGVTEVGDSSYLCSFNMKTYQVTWRPRVVISGACTPDMTYYPFDKQTCIFIYSGWGVQADEMILTSASSEWDLTSYEGNGEWAIIETSTETSIEDYESVITFTITFSRKPLYFAFNIVMPVLILCSLNSVVFLLPAESGERVGFSITCFLSFMVILNMVMDIMPRSSSPISYLCFYLVVMMCNSGAMTLITILLMRVYFKPEKEKVPKWISIAVTFVNCGCARLKCCVSFYKCLTQPCCECQMHNSNCYACAKFCTKKGQTENLSSNENVHSPLAKGSIKSCDEKTVQFCENVLTNSKASFDEMHEESEGIKYSRSYTSNTENRNQKTNTANKPHDNVHVAMSDSKMRISKRKLKETRESAYDQNISSLDYEELPIPDPTYPESPRLKFRKFLKGDILLEPIFNDQPFRNYFKPKLAKKHHDRNEDCSSCFQLLTSKVWNHHDISETENDKEITSYRDSVGVSTTTKNISKHRLPNQDLTKYSDTATKESSIKRLVIKQKQVENMNRANNASQPENLNNLISGKENLSSSSKIGHNDRVYLDTDSVTSESINTDSDSEMNDSEDEEETVQWAEVGRVLDTFFFLVFLGAQIFFTVVFFVPIAAN